MAAQLISYDLVKPDRNYADLFECIKSLGNWWHCVESVWIVITTKSASEVRDAVSRCIDSNDKVAVFTLQGNWATRGLSTNCTDWLTKNL